MGANPGSDLIGTFTILISDLEEGYRHVPLFNKKGELIRFSSIFACFSKKLKPKSFSGCTPVDETVTNVTDYNGFFSPLNFPETPVQPLKFDDLESIQNNIIPNFTCHINCECCESDGGMMEEGGNYTVANAVKRLRSLRNVLPKKRIGVQALEAWEKIVGDRKE
ncbi:hypothetical protein HK096_010060 [Nowakowskiella sp. JEL0078]|nr:hypothetical protein HK096_010060 [Nowakowskiella sp. JEL0078]